jgi:multidrug efflux system membrane fusion protein
VQVSLQLYVDANAVTMPAAAVMTGQQGTYAFRVDNAGKAQQTPLVVARTVDSVAVITSGVNVGDKVVVTGQARLTSGAKVTIKGPGGAGRNGAPGSGKARGAPK